MTKKEIELKGTNLSLIGRGKDSNGNQTVKLKFPNKKAFSIQTNGNLPKTKYIISGNHRMASISQSDLEIIKDEVVDYITKHGSMLQKRMLKAYFKAGGGVGKRSTHSINQDRKRLSKEPHEQAYLPKRKKPYFKDGVKVKPKAFADGGGIKSYYDVVYMTKSGNTMVAKKIEANSEDEATEKLTKQMRASSTFDKPIMAIQKFEGGGEFKSAFESKQDFLSTKDQQERIDILIEEVSKSNWSTNEISKDSGIVKTYSKIYGLEPVRVASIFNKHKKKPLKGLKITKSEYEKALSDYDKYGIYLEDAMEENNDSDIKKYGKLIDETEMIIHTYERKDEFADGGEISKENKESIAKLEKLVNSDNPMITDEVKEKAKKKIAELSKVEEKEIEKEKKAPVKKAEPKQKKYKLGDEYSSDFDYDGMMDYAEKVDGKTSLSTLEKLAESMTDVNYHEEAKEIYKLIDAKKKPVAKKGIDKRIIDKIKEIKDIYGIDLIPDDYFKGIEKHNGKDYFNVMTNEKLSESRVLDKLKIAISQNVISNAEPNGIKRISIFFPEKPTPKKPVAKKEAKKTTPKKEVKAPKDSWKDKLAMLKGKKGYKGKIANEKKAVAGTKSRSIKRDLDKQALPKGKRISKNGNVYYEHRANRSDIDPKQKFKQGGMIEMENTNLQLVGKGRDTNGNSIVKVKLPMGNAFSIQINNPNFKNTKSILSGVKNIKEVKGDDLVRIEKEVVEYIDDFGSLSQKKQLKKYFKQGGEVKSSGWGIDTSW